MNEKAEKIKAMCLEDGDCLIWQGSTTNKGHPMFGRQTAKRALWECSKTKLTKSDVIVSYCGNVLCMEHLEKSSKSDVMVEACKRPEVKAKKIAANLRTRDRNPLAKINMDIARQMRAMAGVKTREEIAKQFNCSVALVKKVQLNDGWKEAEFNPFSGLFTGLMASNTNWRKQA